MSPVEKNTSETLYSLKFAERVRSVELGPGSRRAELASWSSQEHLEVRGVLQACATLTGHRPGEVGPGGGVELEPKPSSPLAQAFLA